MSAMSLHEHKEESDEPNFDQAWLADCGPDVFLDSPESFNLIIKDNLDRLDQKKLSPSSTNWGEEDLDSSTCGWEVPGSSTYGREEDLDSSTYSWEEGLQGHRSLELVLPNSSACAFGANVPAEAEYINSSSMFNENFHDEASTTYPDDFLSAEKENEPRMHNLTDHDYAFKPEPLIVVNENRKGAHYQIIRDVVTVKNFDPSSNNISGTRVPFRTLCKVQAKDEICIFAQYRSNKLSSPNPYEREDTVPYMLPNVAIEEKHQETLKAPGERCKCFSSHPTAAFCVTSEKAEVTWDVLPGSPVARLKIKEESAFVDLSIGFWSTKILNEHGISGKKVFNQIVLQIHDGSGKRKEQFIFYKTCASVTRDISHFYKEVDKAFPLRKILGLIPSHKDVSSEPEPKCKWGGRKKKLKTADQTSYLKITINQDCVQEFLDLLKVTESSYFEIC